MSSLLLILLCAVLVCYYAPLIPALNPFVAADHFESVQGIACASAIVLIVVSPLSYAIEYLLLIPFGLRHLLPLVLVIIVMAVAQLAGMAMRYWTAWLPRQSPFLLLTISNSAVLGVAVLNATRQRGFGDSVLLGLGTAAVFTITLLMFTALQQRQRHANVPLIFRDAPVGLVTAGLMALAYMGFTGLIRPD